MKSIVLVYTNGRTVQGITSTGQPVNPIGYHKGRFKAKSYLPLCREFPIELSLGVASHLHNLSGEFLSCGGLLEKWFGKIIFSVKEIKTKRCMV